MTQRRDTQERKQEMYSIWENSKYPHPMNFKQGGIIGIKYARRDWKHCQPMLVTNHKQATVKKPFNNNKRHTLSQSMCLTKWGASCLGAMATTSSKQYMASCPTKPITHCVNRTAQNTCVKKTAQNQSYTVWKDGTKPNTQCVKRTAQNRSHTVWKGQHRTNHTLWKGQHRTRQCVERTAQNQSHIVWKGQHRTDHTPCGRTAQNQSDSVWKGQHKTNDTLCGRTAQNKSHIVWKGQHKTNHTLWEGQHKTNHTLCGRTAQNQPHTVWKGQYGISQSHTTKVG